MTGSLGLPGGLQQGTTRVLDGFTQRLALRLHRKNAGRVRLSGYLVVLGGWAWVFCGASAALAERTEAPGAVSVSVAPSGVASSRVVTGPAVRGVYRTTGPNGEVEYNNFGNGEPVALDVIPAPDDADLELGASRIQDMLEVAGVLAADRQQRESYRAAQREAARQERAAAARQQAQQAEWLEASQPRYYPGLFPFRRGFGARRGTGYGPDWRPVAGPYRDGYRHPEQPGGASGDADAAPRPVTKQQF